MIHTAGRVACRFIMSQCLRTVVLHRRRADALRGPFILACTHVSHLEPVIVSCLIDRRVDWMARIEFFRHPWAARLLECVDAFSINRQGVPVSAIRTSIERLRQRRVIGIFPEGGVATGKDAIYNGGTLKEGACMIALRVGVPVLPVVVLGTEKLNQIDPWLPMRRGRLWVSFGRAVMPPATPVTRRNRRACRKAMAEELQEEFAQTYRELCQKCGLTNGQVASARSARDTKKTSFSRRNRPALRA
jgi:1-acyl-sn-glycerol-3-phosphate acyltransferase